MKGVAQGFAGADRAPGGSWLRLWRALRGQGGGGCFVASSRSSSWCPGAPAGFFRGGVGGGQGGSRVATGARGGR